jgi:hypothetical protein
VRKHELETTLRRFTMKTKAKGENSVDDEDDRQNQDREGEDAAVSE